MPSHPEKKRVPSVIAPSKRRLPAKAAGTARKRAFGKQGALKRKKR